MWAKRLRAYGELMRWHRPIGSLLLLWPTLWAIWIAGKGHPPLGITLIFAAGVFVMRSAGCVINDIADRHVDGKVRRTQNRPLITGQVSLREAFILFLVLCLLALILVLQLNAFALKLSSIGLLLAVVYPFMKRVTHWPQLVLGLAFAWGIPMVFAAINDELPNFMWWLYLAGVIWPLAYDTQYAMTDRQDDLQAGIKSTAILFAHYDRLLIFLLQTAVLSILTFLGLQLGYNQWFFISLGVAGGFFIYQQYLIKNRDPQLCFKAFLNNQWVGLSIFLGILAHYYTSV